MDHPQDFIERLSPCGGWYRVQGSSSEVDMRSLRAAFQEATALILSISSPVLREIRRREFLALVDCDKRLFSLRTEILPADAAARMRIYLEPTDWMARILETLRAEANPAALVGAIKALL